MSFSKYFLIFLFTGIYSNVFSQISFQEQNLNYKYDITGDVMLSHRVYHLDDSVLIYFSIYPNEGVSTNWIEDYKLEFEFKKDYQSTEMGFKELIELDDYFIHKYKNHNIFLFKLPVEENFKLLELHLKLKSWADALFYDINLDGGLEYGSGGLILCDGSSGKPIFDNFISPSNNIRIKTISGNEKELWVYLYDTDFDIAIPPMIVDNTNVTRSLTVTKTMKINAGDIINFDEEGLYFVQSDTSSLEGIAFRIQSEPFPKLGTYEELLKPIRFISTKTEIEEMENEPDLKKTFESFWVKTNSSASLAQKTIKNYYKYVAEANFYFTGYKEGWKTDMGMIYIIYGKPDKVFKHEEYEQWIYNQNVNMPAIRFTFVKIKNVFSTNHYTLVRDRKFDKQWFRGVELWRKGKM